MLGSHYLNIKVLYKLIITIYDYIAFLLCRLRCPSAITPPQAESVGFNPSKRSIFCCFFFIEYRFRFNKKFTLLFQRVVGIMINVDTIEGCISLLLLTYY